MGWDGIHTSHTLKETRRRTDGGLGRVRSTYKVGTHTLSLSLQGLEPTLYRHSSTNKRRSVSSHPSREGEREKTREPRYSANAARLMRDFEFRMNGRWGVGAGAGGKGGKGKK